MTDGCLFQFTQQGCDMGQQLMCDTKSRTSHILFLFIDVLGLGVGVGLASLFTLLN